MDDLQNYKREWINEWGDEISKVRFMSYFSKCFQCTMNHSASIETYFFLWAGDDKNNMFLQISRQFKHPRIVYFCSNNRHPISGRISKIAMKKWPNQWNEYTDYLNKDLKYSKRCLQVEIFERRAELME